MQTVYIDAETVRMGAWHIKGFDAAVLAEMVLCNARVKCVCRDRVFTLKQVKILARHEQVQKATHVTDAAITARRMNVGRRLDLKLNAATMAATFVRCHASTLCQTAMWLFAGIE